MTAYTQAERRRAFALLTALTVAERDEVAPDARQAAYGALATVDHTIVKAEVKEFPLALEIKAVQNGVRRPPLFGEGSALELLEAVGWALALHPEWLEVRE